jgi:hypothetical protein
MVAVPELLELPVDDALEVPEVLVAALDTTDRLELELDPDDAPVAPAELDRGLPPVLVDVEAGAGPLLEEIDAAIPDAL